MIAGDYVPEYIVARLSAGIMFTMMRVEPKIDSLSEMGDLKAYILTFIQKHKEKYVDKYSGKYIRI
jgi:hypothetical protein